MERVDKNTLQTLARFTGKPCISIYIPTQKVGQEVLDLQGSILLKNNIQEAKLRLEGSGLKSHEIEALIAPMQSELVNNREFWHHQEGGLAVFAGPGFLQYFKLPVAVDEFLHIDGRFFLQPLWALAEETPYFYLLNITRKRCHLFKMHKLGYEEINLGDSIPDNYRVIPDLYELNEQIEPSSKIPGGGGMGAVTVNAHHDESKAKNHMITDYFRLVDAGVMEAIKTDDAPLILAGLDYLHSRYRDANNYKHLVPDIALGGNYDLLPDETLYQEARHLMRPYFGALRKKRLDMFHEMSGGDRISTDTMEILQGGVTGRIHSLFISANQPLWGQYDPNNLSGEIHESYQSGDVSLIDEAALQALSTGADIYVINDIRITTPLAAIFRF